jgi:hypothetical protein
LQAPEVAAARDLRYARPSRTTGGWSASRNGLLGGRAINDRFIIHSFLRKQTLLIKDEKQYETWNRDQWLPTPDRWNAQ